MFAWVVVTDASRGRILGYDTSAKEWSLLRELDNPNGRAKGSELLTDAPGRQRQSFGRGSRPALEPHTDPKVVERDRFVRELAHELNRAHAHRDYEGLVIVAAPQVLGQLRSSLTSVVEKSVLASLDKDYTQLELRDLKERLSPTVEALTQ
jgi:protein required for attachment to host cells